jgi:hypothetical protein
MVAVVKESDKILRSYSHMWRKFPQRVETLAQACFSEPIVETTFRTIGGLQGCGTASRQIEIVGAPMAWAKPARIGPDNSSDVAHEKIAHDLGFLLGLPVSPISIVTNHGNSDFPGIVAVSFSALAQGRQWDRGMDLTQGQARSVASVLGAMRAFHAWIVDSDHDWNDGNAQIERLDENSAAVAFFDYAFSLTKFWRPPNDPPNLPWSSRNGPYASMDPAGALEIIELISKLPLDQIRFIICRLPKGLLAPDLAESLVIGLDKRRSALKGLLNL